MNDKGQADRPSPEGGSRSTFELTKEGLKTNALSRDEARALAVGGTQALMGTTAIAGTAKIPIDVRQETYFEEAGFGLGVVLVLAAAANLLWGTRKRDESNSK